MKSVGNDMNEKAKKSSRPNKELNRQNKAIKEGRSKGHGATYTPFIQVRKGDFPSQGLSAKLWAPNIRRHLHLLSNLEMNTALQLINAGAVDIREQYALRTEDNDPEFYTEYGGAQGTLAIAKEIGIKHSVITKDTPRISTTDFFVLGCESKKYAVYVRYEKDVPSRGSRQYELLLLQEHYWKIRGVKFCVITEKCIDRNLMKTMRWAMDGANSKNSEATEEYLKFLKEHEGSSSLIEKMNRWHEGPVNGLLRFKSGVFIGRIIIKGNDISHKTLNMPWEFRVVSEIERNSKLTQFLNVRGSNEI